MDPVFQSAWQPLTLRGVARFAGASSVRLLVVQFVFALLAAAVVTWCVRATWFPVVEAAIQRLPEQGEVRSGRLHWVAVSPQMLAEGRFLSLAVDLAHGGGLRGAAHVQVELGQESVRVFSLFGYVELRYPPGWVLALNRTEAGPWWGAWSPVILAGVFGGAVAALLVAWAALALAYCVPVWLLGFFTNRALDWRGAWRLCGAAQLPAALFLTVAVFFYGVGLMDPVRLLVAFAVHFPMTWVYLGFSPLTLPAVGAASLPGGNPFASAGKPESPKPVKPANEDPFSPGGR